MKKLHNKISDQRGASILMSMLLMLVSILVCVVGLSAATSAIEARQNSFDEQQKYLAVSSAAEQFIDELQDLEFEAYYYEFYGPNLDINAETGEVTRKANPYYTFNTEDVFGVDESGVFFKPNLNTDSDITSHTFVQMLNYAVQFIRKANAEEVGDDNIVGKFTIQADSLKNTDVNMTLKMDKRFAVTATFALADGSYQIQVKAVPTLTGKSFPLNPSIPQQPERKYPYEHLKDQGLLIDATSWWEDIEDAHKDIISPESVPPSEDEYGTTERYMKLQWKRESISVTKGGTQ